jgi:hypothetical protein
MLLFLAVDRRATEIRLTWSREFLESYGLLVELTSPDFYRPDHRIDSQTFISVEAIETGSADELIDALLAWHLRCHGL